VGIEGRGFGVFEAQDGQAQKGGEIEGEKEMTPFMIIAIVIGAIFCLLLGLGIGFLFGAVWVAGQVAQSKL
jgi:hypothetical protein